MKNKLMELGLSYFLRQRTHGRDSSDNMPELVKPESERERAISVMEDILRWADDGGQMLGPDNRTAASNPETARERANE
ncbi:MAG TPA: hypothetical protein VMN99_00715 [Anaerolineales bacterium]|nr:hypothetical protein [Anaerolineales bacterium]